MATTDVTTLKKISDFSLQFRKSYDELEEIVKICNQMVLRGNWASITYTPVSTSSRSNVTRVFRVKIYRCRQTFSSFGFSGCLKCEPDNFSYYLSIANMVISSNGFVQFHVEEPKINSNEKSVPGPILKIELYEPKDPTKAKLLKQAIESIKLV